MQVLPMAALLVGLICLCVWASLRWATSKALVVFVLLVVMADLVAYVLPASDTNHEASPSAYQPFAPVLVCYGSGCY